MKALTTNELKQRVGGGGENFHCPFCCALLVKAEGEQGRKELYCPNWMCLNEVTYDPETGEELENE